MRITNNRSTFTEMTYPKSWTVIDGDSVSFSTDTLARAIGAAYNVGSGRASRIVDGGDTLVLRLPDGASGTLVADISVMSWLMSGVVDAVQTVGSVAEKAGFAGKGASVLSHSKLSNIFFGTRDTDVTAAMRTCADSISVQTDEPIDQNTFLSLGRLSLTCGAKVGSVLLKRGQGAIASGVISAIVGAVLLAVELGEFAASTLRYLWDEVASFGGQSSPEYRIRVQSLLDPLDAGWRGILPGQDLRSVAHQLGGDYLVDADRCAPAAMLYSQTDWPQIVAPQGGTIEFVEVFDNRDQVGETPEGEPWPANDTIEGPMGIRVGQPVDDFPLLRAHGR